ncbi:MAG TPA: beta-propeller fold lactonase family protein [Candidatus Sulfopaludibacter sp.]|jgi:YVTN family beta-propeller protein|nr:beta-propeller fold lactonase family protein [Candidatus Sulfopaludibacter sp.]
MTLISKFALPVSKFALLIPIALLAGCGPSGPSYHVYISNESSGDLTIIDPVKMEALATVPIGKRARGIHPSPDGKLLYIALSGSPLAPPGVDESTLPPPDKSADGIGVFDIGQNKLTRKIPGGSDPEQFAVGKDGTLFISNEDASGVSFVDPVKGELLHTIPTGAEPEGVSLTPDGKQIYATSEEEGTVTVIDIATAKALKTIKVGRRPRNVSFLPDGSRAFVTNENDGTLTVVDTAKMEAMHDVPLGEGLKPMGQAMTRDGSRLYISTGRGKQVVVFEPSTEKILATFEVGQRPWGIALSPDEKLLFTANGPSNDVSIVDVATHAVIKKIKAGNRPWGVVVLGK